MKEIDYPGFIADLRHSLPIEVMGFQLRTERRLRAGGLRFVGQLREQRPDYLLQFPGVGLAALRVGRAFMEKIGIDLRDRLHIIDKPDDARMLADMEARNERAQFAWRRKTHFEQNVVELLDASGAFKAAIMEIMIRRGPCDAQQLIDDFDFFRDVNRLVADFKKPRAAPLKPLR